MKTVPSADETAIQEELILEIDFRPEFYYGEEFYDGFSYDSYSESYSYNGRSFFVSEEAEIRFVERLGLTIK